MEDKGLKDDGEGEITTGDRDPRAEGAGAKGATGFGGGRMERERRERGSREWGARGKGGRVIGLGEGSEREEDERMG